LNELWDLIGEGDKVGMIGDFPNTSASAIETRAAGMV